MICHKGQVPKCPNSVAQGVLTCFLITAISRVICSTNAANPVPAMTISAIAHMFRCAIAQRNIVLAAVCICIICVPHFSAKRPGGGEGLNLFWCFIHNAMVFTGSDIQGWVQKVGLLPYLISRDYLYKHLHSCANPSSEIILAIAQVFHWTIVQKNYVCIFTKEPFEKLWELSVPTVAQWNVRCCVRGPFELTAPPNNNTQS